MTRAIEPADVYVDAWGAIPASAVPCSAEMPVPEAATLFDAPCPAGLDAYLPDGAVHERAVIELCRGFALGRPTEDVALVYVHRGYQPRFRTPILLALLAEIPSFASVQSVRAPTQDLPLEALLLALASIAGARSCLVIDDRSQRLAPAGTKPDPQESGVRHLSLSRGNGRYRLVRIASEAAERPQLCPIAVSDAFGRKVNIQLDEVRHDHA